MSGWTTKKINYSPKLSRLHSLAEWDCVRYYLQLGYRFLCVTINLTCLCVWFFCLDSIMGFALGFVTIDTALNFYFFLRSWHVWINHSSIVVRRVFAVYKASDFVRLIFTCSFTLPLQIGIGLRYIYLFSWSDKSCTIAQSCTIVMKEA